MFYVYILRLAGSRLYVGYTADLQRRMNEHRRGTSQYTNQFPPERLIFLEQFCNKKDAARRERYFKTSKGRSTIRMMLRETLRENHADVVQLVDTLA